ncbi:MAG TPA: biopolymer transporter ExbD [Flavobacteriales bacterium]|nr:hypothetical protein [Flavobacteriales bacterium]HRE73517.1 biopolymer transporter ExbD [Flavobacteriales bacterium]HRE95461.1 biopolymer transporter ExbD [Flavobacteriales bacterium]HRJ34623.1 biopolymer transporter ExbD [Flavobacteriales bacterium]HRJ37349.1 biopolymer transporter ExbD [Flavobacteriales bacterium]
MKTNRNSEINAGSTADIAFLLLVFFLLVTTMETEEGIARRLPQKVETEIEKEIHERNVLDIRINAANQLLVEDKITTIPELKAVLRDFLTNPKRERSLAEMDFVNEEICLQNWSEIKADDSRKHEEEFWKDRLAMVQQTGAGYFICKDAVISLQNDNATSYAFYIAVQDAIEQCILSLRDEWSMKLYGVAYVDLDQKDALSKERMKVIRSIVPQRLIEREPLAIQMY